MSPHGKAASSRSVSPTHSIEHSPDATSRNGRLLLLAACILYLLLWGRLIKLQPSHDEWLWISIFRDPLHEFGWFIGVLKGFVTPAGQFWRPLTALPLILGSGNSFIVPQVLKLLAIIGIAWYLVKVARTVGFHGWWSYAIASAFLLHQGLIVSSDLDWWGDVICTFAMLCAFHSSLLYAKGSVLLTRHAAIIALLTAVSLLAKEAGVVVPLIPLIVALLWPRPDTASLRNSWLAPSVGVLVLCVYLVIRLALGIPFTGNAEDSYYALSFGKNVFANVALLGVALLSPVDTIRVVMDGGYWRYAAVLFTAVGVAICVIGFLADRGRAVFLRLLTLSVLLLTVQGPTLLMPHVTEGNFSRSLAFGVLIVALCLQSIVARATPAIRWGLFALVGIIAIFHIAAIDHKVNSVIAVHQKARQFREQVVKLLPVPPKRPLVFIAERSEKGYSIFDQPLYILMAGDADIGLKYQYGDPDFSAKVVVVESLDVMPDSLEHVDFLVNRDGKVTFLPLGTLNHAPS